MSKPFAQLIDYNLTFAELAKRGIVMGDEDKEKFKVICESELKQWDGNALIGSNLGASVSDFVYLLFSLIQNVFHGMDFNNIGNSLSNATDTTSAKGKLHMLNEATTRIYQRFTQEGRGIC